MARSLCPFCGDPADSKQNDMLECARCGKYEFTPEAYEKLQSSGYTKKQLFLIKHNIATYSIKAKGWKVDAKWVDNIINTCKLPSIGAIANDTILYIGNGLSNETIAWDVHLEYAEVANVLGIDSEKKFNTIIMGLREQGYLESNNTTNLSFSGWMKYEELDKGMITSPRAFMAMKYGAEDLENIYANCIQPAVEQTGFTIKKLNEEPEAGLIDNLMRQRIRQSRFIIADLTHGNNGAYWESGYAEGLGKPVIFTCEVSQFNEAGTHFDVNHLHTIVWDKNNHQKFIKSIKSTIRNTIADALQEDSVQ
ncbi:MAG: hypothetical protein JXR42_01310 [Gammaproteobacteria bacterium]|nr:hypothetical protein [Gammaproteobacteria bacterium]